MARIKSAPIEQVTFSDGKVSNAVPFGKCGCEPLPRPCRQTGQPAKPSRLNPVNQTVLPPPPIQLPVPDQRRSLRRRRQPCFCCGSKSKLRRNPRLPQQLHRLPPTRTECTCRWMCRWSTLPTRGDDSAGPVPAPVLATPDALYLPAPVYMALFRPVMDTPTVTPLAPAAKPPKEKKGLFGRLRSFFGGMFH